MADGERMILREAPAPAPPAAAQERVALEPLPAGQRTPAAAASTDAVPPVVAPAPDARVLDRRSLRLFGAGLALGAGLLVLQTGAALLAAFERSLLLGSAWTAVVGLLGMAAGRSAWRSYRHLRRLKAQEALRGRAERLLSHEGITEGVAFCETLARDAGIAATPPCAEWRRQLSAAHNDREALQLYERIVLRPRDAEALACVGRHAGDVTVMVALSYFPAVDALLVLWRQLGLVEELTRIYGVDPGYWGRIRLLRKVLRNVAFAGASEIAAEVGMEVLGAGITAKVSAAAAQGMAAGVLTARLGLRAMEACRVIPWESGEAPRLRQVTGAVLETAKRHLLEGKP